MNPFKGRHFQRDIIVFSVPSSITKSEPRRGPRDFLFDEFGNSERDAEFFSRGDTVIRPHAEGAVRVQLRVGQAVTCRVRGIRDADIQIRCGGVDAGQPAGVAVAVTPGLARAADADEFAVVVPGVIAR